MEQNTPRQPLEGPMDGLPCPTSRADGMDSLQPHVRHASPVERAGKLEAMHQSVKKLLDTVEAGKPSVELVLMEAIHKLTLYLDCLRKGDSSDSEFRRLEALGDTDHWDSVTGHIDQVLENWSNLDDSSREVETRRIVVNIFGEQAYNEYTQELTAEIERARRAKEEPEPLLISQVLGRVSLSDNEDGSQQQRPNHDDNSTGAGKVRSILKMIARAIKYISQHEPKEEDISQALHWLRACGYAWLIRLETGQWDVEWSRDCLKGTRKYLLCFGFAMCVYVGGWPIFPEKREAVREFARTIVLRTEPAETVVCQDVHDLDLIATD